MLVCFLANRTHVRVRLVRVLIAGEKQILMQKVLDSYEWQQLHERLDRTIAEVALGYLRKLTIRRIPINVKKLSDELDELRLGREPDYNIPGLPLVYALKYMPSPSFRYSDRYFPCLMAGIQSLY